MITAMLTTILLYLAGLEIAERKQNKVRKIEQYKKQVGCYLFNL